MPWIRCPHGCIFELPPLNWGVFQKFPDSDLVCDNCHRSNRSELYIEQPNASAVKAVDGTTKIDKELQVGIDQSVCLRISKVMGNLEWFGINQDLLVKQLFAKVAQLLVNSEITSNFPTSRIWAILASGGVLKNMWAKGAQLDSRYAKERDDGEKRLFVPLSDQVSVAPTGAGRPYYMALSPGCLQQGAAPYYGRSYVVYKDAVKLRCTFTATDSLQMLKQTSSTTNNPWDLCTMSTIANILMRVSDNELKYLCCLASGLDAVSPNEFIEAQGWGEINLKSDVEIIVLSENDLKVMVNDKSPEGDLVAPELMQMSATQRGQAIPAMKQELAQFCTRNGIKLVYLPLGPDTMNSRDSRPL